MPPLDELLLRPAAGLGLLPPTISAWARTLAARCWASMRGSSCWARSHQTVAFCLRSSATYELGGPWLAPEREDVERRMDEAYDEGAPETGRLMAEALCDATDEALVEVVAFERVRRFAD